MNIKVVKQVVYTLVAFIIPFIILLLLDCGIVMSFVIALIVDAFILGAFLVNHKALAKVKDLSYEEICDHSTGIIFKIQQDGNVIESVSLNPQFIEIEHKKADATETEKAVIPFSSWGVDGSKTYLHASKAVKDYLGKKYSIVMAGDYIVISRKEEQKA